MYYEFDPWLLKWASYETHSTEVKKPKSASDLI